MGINYREFFIKKIIEKTGLKRVDFMNFDFFKLKEEYSKLYEDSRIESK